MPGSFECECEPGYSGDGYSMCNEVNDCLCYDDDPDSDDATLVDYAIKEYDSSNRPDQRDEARSPARTGWTTSP